MTHTFDIAASHKLLVRMLLAMSVLFLGVMAATPTASALSSCSEGPCDESPCDESLGDESQLSAEAEDPCSTPCTGESSEDGDCVDDCQFCSCCSMTAPAALVYASFGSGLDALAFRGDLPPGFKAHFSGITPGVFKPPRHLAA
jgi:hypothetical protein